MIYWNVSKTPSSKVCCSTASKWMVMSETRRIADYTRRYKTKRTVVTCLSLFFFYYFFLLFLFSLYFLMYSIWPAMASSFRHETAQWQPTQAKASISCKHFLFLSTLSLVSIFIFGLSIRFERGAGRRSVGRAPCLFQIVGLKGKVTHTHNRHIVCRCRRSTTTTKKREKNSKVEEYTTQMKWVVAENCAGSLLTARQTTDVLL